MILAPPQSARHSPKLELCICPNMIKEHYNPLVKPSAAQAWFSIRSAALNNVTRFRKEKAA
jgi:hypothetical protein